MPGPQEQLDRFIGDSPEGTYNQFTRDYMQQQVDMAIGDPNSLQAQAFIPSTPENPFGSADPARPPAPEKPALAPVQLPPGQTYGPSPVDGHQPEPITPTPDLLREFLESDPAYMLNLVTNHFRASGTSQVFVNWFERMGNNFWNRYLGHIAEQAYNGNRPTLSFVDWVESFDVVRDFFADSPGRTATGGPVQSGRFASWVAQRDQA